MFEPCWFHDWSSVFFFLSLKHQQLLVWCVWSNPGALQLMLRKRHNDTPMRPRHHQFTMNSKMICRKGWFSTVFFVFRKFGYLVTQDKLFDGEPLDDWSARRARAQQNMDRCFTFCVYTTGRCHISSSPSDWQKVLHFDSIPAVKS